MSEKEELRDSLKKLVYHVHSACNEGKAKKCFKPEKELFFKRKIQGYKYDDNGPNIKSWAPQKLQKRVWYAARTIIAQEIKKLEIYNKVLARLCTTYSPERGSCEYSLCRFIDRIIWETLESEITNKSSLEPYIQSFLKDLNNKEQKYQLTAQIHGVILQPESIKLDEHTLLRKPARQDIEVEYPAESFFIAGGKIFEPPSAILEISGTSSTDSIYLKPQKEIDEAISILCLFRVGGIEYFKFTTHTDSLLATGLTSSERIHPAKSGSYLVRNVDVKPLKAFWARLKRVKLPDPYAASQEPNELSIAYARYNDSLDEGAIEKRIFSAVMGLEALYLGEEPKDRGETSYKLRMRVSKLLSLLGYEPNEVRCKMRDAYAIRSTYVHGSLISKKDRRKYEKDYGDLNEFSRVIMDYLRASIIALLERRNKKSMINIIDESFLDSEKGKEVIKLLFMPYEKEKQNAPG